MAHYGDMQNAIYNAGLRGVLPDYPVDFATLEARAQKALSPSLLNYVQGGCGDEYTQDRNAEAFRHWGMVPRMLVDCSERDLSIDLFGLKLPSPIFMAPIGLNGEVTQDRRGDLAAARASAATGVPFCASTLSNSPMEEVCAAAGDVPGFFQLYTPKNEDLTASLLTRAKDAGYRAIVVTLDTWVTGWRPRDLNSASFPQLRGKVLQNYFSDPVFRSLLDRPPEDDPAAGRGVEELSRSRGGAGGVDHARQRNEPQPTDGLWDAMSPASQWKDSLGVRRWVAGSTCTSPNRWA